MNKEYNICPECGKKVVKEYPDSFHSKCFEAWGKYINKENDSLNHKGPADKKTTSGTKVYKTISGVYINPGWIDLAGNFTEMQQAAICNKRGRCVNSVVKVTTEKEKQNIESGVYTDWYWGGGKYDFFCYINPESKITEG